MPQGERNDKKTLSLHGKKNLGFYIAIMAFPVLQFCIFYIGVNFSSLFLAFQKIDVLSGDITWTLSNFSNLFKEFSSTTLLSDAVRMSLINYLISLICGTSLGLFFSYYISKKLAGSMFYRVVLFLPSIISSIVLVTIYKFFVEEVVPAFWFDVTGKTIKGLLENFDTRFFAIAFYVVFIGFGTSVLMYSNSMSEIDPEIIEAGELDGVSGIKEFWYITLPMVFPTLKTFLIIGVAGIFTSQMELFSFYGEAAPEKLQTFGYYLYNQTESAIGVSEYPRVAALGILLTCIAVPLTFLVKYLLDKYGFSEN